MARVSWRVLAHSVRMQPEQLPDLGAAQIVVTDSQVEPVVCGLHETKR